jgi:hypothetical protein
MSMAIRREAIMGRRQTGRGTAAQCPPAAPACPACGQLECLCRPRFFAGQLLTEDDLRRLDRYIVEKNKLHNRNLHDWGTVCGLEVSCHPCGDHVYVSTGHAIDRCGNDIVVCEPDCVDVCALIKRCKKPQKLECRPYSSTGDCKEVEEEWILAIRFCERPSRGVAALRGPAKGCATCGASASCGSCGSCSSCSGCSGCGGCSGCSTCDCNGGAVCGPDSKWTPSKRLPKRSSPAECEPTVVCESYVYEVFKKPKDDDETCDYGGALAKRWSCCLEAFFDVLPTPPGNFDAASYDADPEGWHDWCCQTKEALLEWFATYPGFDCEAIRNLQLLVCPEPTPTNYSAVFSPVATQLSQIFLQIFLDCLCSGLLPPCREPTCDLRVPLASVTVKSRDCRVVRVCNWTPCRKIAVTIPSLRYWLSAFPLGQAIRDLVHRLCCELEFEPPRPETPGSNPGGFVGQPSYKVSVNAKNLSAVIAKSATKTEAGFHSIALAANALGRDAPGHDRLLEPSQSGLVPQFLLLEQVARPVLKAIMEGVHGGDGGSRGERVDETEGDVRTELAELRALIAEQADEIAALREQLDADG